MRIQRLRGVSPTRVIGNTVSAAGGALIDRPLVTTLAAGGGAAQPVAPGEEQRPRAEVLPCGL
jgi:hypothetical protein